MKVEELAAYEVVSKQRLEDMNSIGYLCRHKKTGALVALISNDDKNKVFNIAFRTPPENSTGVAHIVEHTVLCGSKKFPAKDPFMELEKSSLNTFLNAMTYPDKTMYPVASCNDKDFQNLMDVYLDAVFHPNIYLDERIFMQEGWHYEMESVEDPLTINGVVYNEMKGAFSSADDVLSREIMNSLFPDNTYGLESGGDPEVIPQLTYGEYLDFHRKYYHPSNSYIYLYGDMDMAEKLAWIDENYLSEYGKEVVDSKIPFQKAFQERREVKKEYSITEKESLENNTYLTLNFAVGSSLDKNLYLALQILDYVLCSAKGSPVKEALIKKGIGTEVYSYYENGIQQPYFSFVAKNANESQKQEFVDTVMNCIKDLVQNGLNQKSLLAGINHFEFRYREADFGNYPKGLMYGLQMFDSWLYQWDAPFIHLQASETYQFLKDNIATGYFEKLLEEYFLNSEHQSVLVLAPKRGLTAQKEKELEEKLANYKKTLSNEELEQIVAKTNDLLHWQETEDSKEVLDKIPRISLQDIKKEAEPLRNEIRTMGKTKFLYHDVFTNKIAYIKFLFDIDELPGKYYPYLGIFKSILTGVDTENYTYAQLSDETHIYIGSTGVSIATYTDAKDSEKYCTKFEVKIKVLESNIRKALELIHEILFTSKLEDKDRIKEILKETRSRVEGDYMGAGHVTAVGCAEGYFSKAAKVGEVVSGYEAYVRLVDLLEHYDEKIDEVIAVLKELPDAIFRKDSVMLDVTATEESLISILPQVEVFMDKLSEKEVERSHFDPVLSKDNEGLACASQVQYVCRAGNFKNKNIAYTGSLRVAKSILARDYLWNNVRVKNGAYGCMCNFRQSGDSYFVSYRDPNLKETLEVYDKAADYMEHLNMSQEDIEKFIIGTISDMDVPMTPYSEGSRSLIAYLSNYTFDQIQKEREEVLATTLSDVQKSAEAIRAFLSDDCICVVGNEGKITEAKELFTEVKPLILA